MHIFLARGVYNGLSDIRVIIIDKTNKGWISTTRFSLFAKGHRERGALSLNWKNNDNNS